MKTNQYKAREYRTKAVIEKAGVDIRVLAYSLLPKGYSIKVDSCDKESENEFTPRYKYHAQIIPDHDAPHFVAYSRTENGVYARVVEIMFQQPISPIV